MEDRRQLPTEEDYRGWADVWRRVAPELEPYPETSGSAADAPRENALAGPEPCCMGAGAAGELEVLEGFLRDEIAAAQEFRCAARRASDGAARRAFRGFAAGAERRARELQAAHYLIAARPYRVTVCRGAQPAADCRGTLRAYYHAAACGGFNYERASEETVDPCLRKLFARLAEESFALADALRALLAGLL